MCGVIYRCVAKAIVIFVDFGPCGVDSYLILDGIGVMFSIDSVLFKLL